MVKSSNVGSKGELPCRDCNKNAERVDRAEPGFWVMCSKCGLQPAKTYLDGHAPGFVIR